MIHFSFPYLIKKPNYYVYSFNSSSNLVFTYYNYFKANYKELFGFLGGKGFIIDEKLFELSN